MRRRTLSSGLVLLAIFSVITGVIALHRPNTKAVVVGGCDLTAYWRFDNSGADDSGNGHDLTVNGDVSYVGDVDGNAQSAAYFGTGRMETSVPVEIGAFDPYMLAFQWKADGNYNPTWRDIIAGSQYSLDAGLHVYQRRIVYYPPATTTPPQLDNNTWYDVVFVFDGDGTAQILTRPAGVGSYTTSNINIWSWNGSTGWYWDRIGASGDGWNEYTRGTIDNMRIIMGNDQSCLDVEPPAGASVPDLQAESDTGSSSTDNVTNDATPTFDVTCTDGATVELRESSTTLASGTCAGGTIVLTTSALSDGIHSITSRQDGGTDSTALSVTIDTAAPSAPGAPALTSASDTVLGDPSGDGNTRDTTPSLSINSVETGSTVQMFSGATLMATIASATGSTVTVTTSTLSLGTYVFTTKQTDPAGNLSSASSGTSIRVVNGSEGFECYNPELSSTNYGMDVVTRPAQTCSAGPSGLTVAAGIWRAEFGTMTDIDGTPNIPYPCSYYSEKRHLLFAYDEDSYDLEYQGDTDPSSDEAFVDLYYLDNTDSWQLGAYFNQGSVNNNPTYFEVEASPFQCMASNVFTTRGDAWNYAGSCDGTITLTPVRYCENVSSASSAASSSVVPTRQCPRCEDNACSYYETTEAECLNKIPDGMTCAQFCAAQSSSRLSSRSSARSASSQSAHFSAVSLQSASSSAASLSSFSAASDASRSSQNILVIIGTAERCGDGEVQERGGEQCDDGAQNVLSSDEETILWCSAWCTRPVCGDGRDNDGDGKKDRDDPGCYDAALEPETTTGLWPFIVELFVSRPTGRYMPGRREERCTGGYIKNDNACVSPSTILCPTPEGEWKPCASR